MFCFRTENLDRRMRRATVSLEGIQGLLMQVRYPDVLVVLR